MLGQPARRCPQFQVGRSGRTRNDEGRHGGPPQPTAPLRPKRGQRCRVPWTPIGFAESESRQRVAHLGFPGFVPPRLLPAGPQCEGQPVITVAAEPTRAMHLDGGTDTEVIDKRPLQPACHRWDGQRDHPMRSSKTLEWEILEWGPRHTGMGRTVTTEDVQGTGEST